MHFNGYIIRHHPDTGWVSVQDMVVALEYDYCGGPGKYAYSIPSHQKGYFVIGPHARRDRLLLVSRTGVLNFIASRLRNAKHQSPLLPAFIDWYAHNKPNIGGP